ncbi:MAG TPA: hypothetical protein VIM56_03855 [Rhizomicrobium sp.]
MSDERPPSDAAAFMRGLLERIAKSLDLSYEELTADFLLPSEDLEVSDGTLRRIRAAIRVLARHNIEPALVLLTNAEWHEVKSAAAAASGIHIYPSAPGKRQIMGLPVDIVDAPVRELVLDRAGAQSWERRTGRTLLERKL